MQQRSKKGHKATADDIIMPFFFLDCYICKVNYLKKNISTKHIL